ncbi:hypothetical protein VM1G_11377 [Cytospora mali]|uniref:Uncharacterized protein n=1 Tax=Cytospora mali TaxID=578113 RepID=A0A194VNP2_CYTMA|nr:hypothetical protein VM1G_11377 [Valsa mali]
MTEVDELPLQLMLELLEGLDGLFPGGVGRAKVDGLRGGLLFGFILNLTAGKAEPLLKLRAKSYVDSALLGCLDMT